MYPPRNRKVRKLQSLKYLKKAVASQRRGRIGDSAGIWQRLAAFSMVWLERVEDALR